jgi:hypothetical protein
VYLHTLETARAPVTPSMGRTAHDAVRERVTAWLLKQHQHPRDQLQTLLNAAYAAVENTESGRLALITFTEAVRAPSPAVSWQAAVQQLASHMTAHNLIWDGNIGSWDMFKHAGAKISSTRPKWTPASSPTA